MEKIGKVQVETYIDAAWVGPVTCQRSLVDIVLSLEAILLYVEARSNM